jgi:alpha-D-ribose 1-methylphosphonate 5-triphosphate diphosphatase
MFHCICYVNPHDERSLRSADNADLTVSAINRLAPHLNVRNKIHLRYDIPSVEVLPNVHARIEAQDIHLLSLMDHTPGQGQFRDLAAIFKRRNMSKDEIKAYREKFTQRQDKIKKADIENLIRTCQQQGIPVASHDDDTREKVEWTSEMNVQISEFPVTMEALEEAHRRGMYIGFGSPNYLRGQSHSNNISARDALRKGYGDFICSDYAPMTMIHVVFLLHDLDFAPLPELVNMVTLNPAKAVKIDAEVGSIEVGKFADILIVDAKSEVPRLSRVFVGGQEIVSLATP